MTPELPHILDFEASGLGSNSYPIQVGWSLDDGTVECHCIDPTRIPSWTDWDYKAEREIHGITRAHLAKAGKPPREVAQAMNQALAGSVVYSDAPDYDRHWCEELFRVAWMRPQFVIESFESLTRALPVDAEAHRQAYASADRQFHKRRHDAGNDVEYLLLVYRILREGNGKL